MRFILILIILSTVLCAAKPVQGQESLTADQIIERYIEAIGGYDNIKSLQNIVYRNGTYEEGDYTSNGDSTMSVARPFHKLVGDKTNINGFPSGFMEGNDGSAWGWYADPGIVIRTVGPASEASRHYAGVEGPLVDYRKKGSIVSIKDETEFDGKTVVVLLLTRRDGFKEQFYIDTETYLILASGAEAPIHAFDDDVTKLSRKSDYRDVEGVKIAHRSETVTLPSGNALDSMQWGTIEANVELPADWFSPPSFERTPIQRFIEQLYIQRTDIHSMMWTYHEFRLAYPDVDTSNASNVAGFQSLKMESIDAAITLLEQNAIDYPNVVDAWFGLGRAYRTAGRFADAREQFRAALAIDPDNERTKDALEALEK